MEGEAKNMENTLEIRITAGGNVAIPWTIESFEELLRLIKCELGEEEAGVRPIFGEIYCG